MSKTTPQGTPLRERDVLSVLRAECKEAGSQVAWARRHGLSAPYVSDVLLGRRAPGASILAALGLQRDVSYSQRPDA